MTRIYDTLRPLFSEEMFHILVLNFDSLNLNLNRALLLSIKNGHYYPSLLMAEVI